MKDLNKNKNLNSNKDKSFLVPEINPLDEIKNELLEDSSVNTNKKEKNKSIDEFVFTSMKNDKEEIKKENLEKKDDKSQNILKQNEEEIRNNKVKNSFKKVDEKSKSSHSKQKRLLIFGFLFLILFIVCGAFYFLSNKDNSELELFDKKSPQTIINASFGAMDEVKNYSFQGKIESKSSNLKLNDKVNQEDSTKIDLTGKVERTNVNHQKGSYSIKLKNNIINKIANISTSIDFDFMEFDAEKNTKSYIKLNDYHTEIDGIKTEIVNQVLLPLEKYKRNWYLLELEDLQNVLGTNDILKTFNTKFFYALFQNYEILEFREDLGDSQLNNTDVYHYSVRLNSKEIANLYLDLLDDQIVYYENNNQQEEFFEIYNLTTEELKTRIKKYRINLDKLSEAIHTFTDNTNIELWIGKNDELIYRVKLDFSSDENLLSKMRKIIFKKNTGANKTEDLDEIPEQKNSETIINGNFDINFSAFNGPVEIVEPEDAENLSSILQEALGFVGLPGGIIANDFDRDGLSNEMENIYGSDMRIPDTDGDGYLDGDEVINGYDPLIPGDARLENIDI